MRTPQMTGTLVNAQTVTEDKLPTGDDNGTNVMRSQQCWISVEILERTSTQDSELSHLRGPFSASQHRALFGNISQLIARPMTSSNSGNVRSYPLRNVALRVCLCKAGERNWVFRWFGASRRR